MATAERSDPVLGHNFEITFVDTVITGGSALLTAVLAQSLGAVLDSPSGGFSECSGLQMTLDVEDYEEGGSNGTILKLPKRVKWNPITLKRGVGTGTELWDWFYSFVTGHGIRRDGVITLRNARREPHSVWVFVRGMPTRWDGPSLNGVQSQVAIESIEIVHEGLFRLPAILA
jgi:phage tail-like protein